MRYTNVDTTLFWRGPGESGCSLWRARVLVAVGTLARIKLLEGQR